MKARTLSRHLASRRSLRCIPLFGKSAQVNQWEERMHESMLAGVLGTVRIPSIRSRSGQRRFDYRIS